MSEHTFFGESATKDSLDDDREVLVSIRETAANLGRLCRAARTRHRKSRKALDGFADSLDSSIDWELNELIAEAQELLDEINAAEERKHEDIERDVIRRAQAGGV